MNLSIAFIPRSRLTSPQIDRAKGNRRRIMQIMKINVKSVYGVRSIGVGHAPLFKLCGFLNMPLPTTKNGYDDLSYSIKVPSKQVAEKSMSDAAARLCGTEQAAYLRVSVDGTWQRKGFSSTLRVVTSIYIDNGNTLNVAVLSKSCKGCASMTGIVSFDPTRY